jgi:hypothetical protein
MYRATYQKKGWGLKPSFMEMYNSLASVTAAESNKPVYSEYAVKAEEFIYSSLPTVVAVMVDESQKDDRNRPGKKITTWLLRTEKNTLPLRKPAKFGLNKRTSVGTVFDVKLQDSRVVWIKEHIGSISLSWLKTVGGEAQLRTDKNGRKYAIISGTYVGEKLLKGVVDGQTINVLAIVQPDGRWKAITRLNS